MSAPFFANPAAVAAYTAELQSWRGTPFLAHGSAKRVGVDCVNLVGKVMVAAGAVQSYDFGDYQLDWSAHRTSSRITEYLDAIGGFQRLEAEPGVGVTPMVGDIVCFTIGQSIGHCGLMLDGNVFMHVIMRGRVCQSQLGDPTWSKRLACFYRRMNP